MLLLAAARCACWGTAHAYDRPWLEATLSILTSCTS